MVLKTYAARGSDSEGLQTLSEPSFGFTPFIGVVLALSSGEGRQSSIVSIRSFTPMLAVAEPTTTGMNFLVRDPSLIPLNISSSVRSPPSRYRSSSSSSASATFSTSFILNFSIISCTSAGISISSLLPSLYSYAFIWRRSTIPLKAVPSPTGMFNGMASVSKDFSISLRARSKLAFSLSILFTNITLGSSYSQAYFQIFSVSAFTPDIALTRTTAPSDIRRQPRVSSIKFINPGVSMMLYRLPFHSQKATADEIDMFLSISSGS